MVITVPADLECQHVRDRVYLDAVVPTNSKPSWRFTHLSEKSSLSLDPPTSHRKVNPNRRHEYELCPDMVRPLVYPAFPRLRGIGLLSAIRPNFKQWMADYAR